MSRAITIPKKREEQQQATTDELAEKNEPAKPESRLESAGSIFAQSPAIAKDWAQGQDAAIRLTKMDQQSRNLAWIQRHPFLDCRLPIPKKSAPHFRAFRHVMFMRSGEPEAHGGARSE
jgi:hypothetical protein